MKKKIYVALAFFLSLSVSLSTSAESYHDSNCVPEKPCFRSGHVSWSEQDVYDKKFGKLFDEMRNRMAINMDSELFRKSCKYLEAIENYRFDAVELPLSWIPYARLYSHYHYQSGLFECAV